MLSPLDDYPIHQIAEPIRSVGPSDRNFYDRYYFNCHSIDGDVCLIAGMGQYPNLGVQDAFVVVLRENFHRVVRASRELGADRMDTSVGPFRVEVLEGLKRLRLVCEPNEWDLDFDLTFEGAIPAFQEPRHYIRQHERVVFDTMRLAQTGRWSGRLNVAGERFKVEPTRWWGVRDRSWGVRPVGEPEPPGLRANRPPQAFFWIYAPMQFEDCSIVTIMQEESDGSRILEESTRVWPASSGRGHEWLGRPEHRLEFVPGTRNVRRATLSFRHPRGEEVSVQVEPLLPVYFGVGTGYGFDADWRHGMYQGELKVEGLTLDLRDPEAQSRLFGLVDHVARYEWGGRTGFGLFEVGFFGPHEQYGFKDWGDAAS